MLIGRQKEIRFLNDALADQKSHLIAVYGRRRIGKTFLVRETYGNRFTFQHAGVADGSMADQLYAFSASMKDAGFPIEQQPKHWLEAFEGLKDLVRQSKEKKKILFIDELSWMDTPKSKMLAALENFWNGWASSRNDVVLIVCASATSWMLSKIIHNKGGLYNRLTGQIHLEPFTLSECEEYIKSQKIAFNRNQILQYYMIFGGVPYYWTFLQKGFSLSQNVDRCLFAKDAPLKDEFRFLFASLFKNPEGHLKIVHALGKKKVGMTREDLIKETGMLNSGDFTGKLEELESSGFIRAYSSFGKKKKDTIYQLIDNFTLFYYQFLAGNPNDENFWTNQLNMPKVNSWMGLAFERICLQHIYQIKQKLGITGVLTETCSWYCKKNPEKGLKGSQIDLLIVRKDQVINLCEIKYSNSEYTITEKVDQNIRNKISDLQISTGTKYAIYPTLITSYGLTDNSYAGNIQAVVTADDLFRREEDSR